MSEAYRERLLEEATQPAEEPLSLAEAKLYLRVDGTEEDALITELIIAVRRAAEQYLRRTLVTRRWRLVYDGYAPEVARLPMGRVSSVVSVTEIAEGGATTSVDSALYALNAARTALCFSACILAHQVEILYEAGYPDAATVPSSFKQGMLAHLAELYDGRSSASGLPEASVALYRPYREVGV